MGAPVSHYDAGYEDALRDAIDLIREHARTTGSMHPSEHFVVGLECAARLVEKLLEEQ